ncbi:MAG: isoaspartyl peptidase/L-asparaginase [Verrucomicrobia bacterium]|nr:isoaspartyl peptidase/L-asparaginase [Verrucomicrobiota bacterium]
MEGSMFSFKQYHLALSKIIKKAYPILREKGSREAVIKAIKLLEDNPIFNAGKGSKLQCDGRVRMSSAIMSSDDSRFSGVINIRNVKNPIQIADLLSKEKHTVLGGREACEYARKNNVKYFDPITEDRLKEFKEKRSGDTGTVGAVALDDKGIICVGTSTGGVGYELPGRIGDSATVAGTYVSNMCGVSCTGRGEHIVNYAVAARVVSYVECGKSLKEAVTEIIGDGNEDSRYYGLISLDYQGNFVVGETDMATVLYASYDGELFNTFFKDQK